MNIKSWNLFLVLGLLAFLGAGSGILYSNHIKKQEEAEQARIEAIALAQEKAEQAVALKQEFEGFLNGFLRNVYDQMNVYKKRRAVLLELGAPENLRSPDYIAENAGLADATFASLGEQMGGILSSFEEADQNVRPLIDRFEQEQDRAVVQKSWEKIRDENAEKFTTFFTTDQDLLRAQLALIGFYNDHKDTLEVDVENGRVIFETLESQEQEALLRGRVTQMRAAQKDVLKTLSTDNP